jgi:hypothetical protein
VISFVRGEVDSSCGVNEEASRVGVYAGFIARIEAPGDGWCRRAIGVSVDVEDEMW